MSTIFIFIMIVIVIIATVAATLRESGLCRAVVGGMMWRERSEFARLSANCGLPQIAAASGFTHTGFCSERAGTRTWGHINTSLFEFLYFHAPKELMLVYEWPQVNSNEA
uniref:Secreted protein n=1 Tax=Anopheles farauti TaxID=69004 RepID=A0A182QP87_9DIPT